MEKIIKLSIEKAKELYKVNPEYRNTLLHDFTDEELEIFPKYPTKLEEIERNYFISGYGDVNSLSSTYSKFSSDRNQFITKERGEEVASLIALLAFRDAVWEIDEYNPGNVSWEHKYVIIRINNNIASYDQLEDNYTLIFKTKETRDWFLKTHRELIEKCKNLI